jgi:valine--pyruvate aminotransferase
MKLSTFGERFTARDIGILRLMEDLGDALTGDNDILMLGGGNPAHIPAVQARIRAEMEHVLATPNAFERMIGNYDGARGETEFIAALAALLKRRFGWPISPANIALTNGSQSAFFFLFNALAGRCSDGSHRKILLPLTPEYIGYTDIGLADDFFVAARPEITLLDDHMFKYHVDFNALRIGDDIGAICVSRPTNPTGNVLTQGELEKLSALARAHGIPLIIDNAYGTPFPNIIFVDAAPLWDEHIIVCMSLSKFGLPTTRTGIVIANERISAGIGAMNAIMCLAPGKFGATLARRLVQSDEIIALSNDIIRPFYQRKAEAAVAQVCAELAGTEFAVHKPEGALFLWLWFRNLPITCAELYERLKRRGVLVVPGQYFFPGLRDGWQHQHECIRVTYAQDDETVRRGLSILADEVKRVYADASTSR